ncbi:MAG: hypothetical protein IT448_00425 [Phycisphaerales bacterium]|nr:hypothetical protein [Phycisphaerales bacterium]
MPERYDALYRLWEVYLHMRAWGLPEYEGLGAAARKRFAVLVKTGALFTYVEDCKRDVLRAGLSAPDAWLWPLCADRCNDGVLPQEERDRLGRTLSEIYLQLVRLDPDANPAGSDNQSKNKGGRPKMTNTEAEKRTALIAKWQQAQGAGESMKDFCGYQGIQLSHLKAVLSWDAKRQQRGNKPQDK